MYNISLITGDGIGPEISESALSVLETINDKLDLKLFKDLLITHSYKYKRFFFSMWNHSMRGIYKTSFFEPIEKEVDWSQNYINSAILSHVLLQSKNISPNFTSEVVETVNTALGPAWKTSKYPWLPFTYKVSNSPLSNSIIDLSAKERSAAVIAAILVSSTP